MCLCAQYSITEYREKLYMEIVKRKKELRRRQKEREGRGSRSRSHGHGARVPSGADPAGYGGYAR